MLPLPWVDIFLFSHPQAAYRDNTLGLPKICPEENIPLISREILYSYMQSVHTPDRMVVAGVGMEHEELLKSCQKHFAQSVPPIWTTLPAGANQRPLDQSVSQYTGGIVSVSSSLLTIFFLS